MGEIVKQPVIETELGLLPEDWEALPISSFAQTATGGTPSRDKSEYFGGQVPWVRSGELGDRIITGTEETITEEGLANSNAKLFPAGTLLMALYGATTGKVGILGIEAATNQAICAIFPDKNIAASDYLFYALMHRRPHLLKARYGGAQPNISQTLVRSLSLPLPPLPEQRAIARVLRTVQRAKEATEKVIAATRQLKQSLMRHLFTYGPVPFDQADRVKLRETEIDSIPESWELEELKNVADVAYGVQAAVAHLKDPSKGVPILTNVNITSDGAIDLTTLRYYELPKERRERYTLKKGDVLFNWRSGSQEHVGKTALFNLNGEFTHSSFILRLRPSNKIRSEFLAQYLHWLRSRGFFAQRRQQSSVNSVFNKSLSETIPVVVPPQGIQDKIAEQLLAVDAKQAAEEARRAALEALFQSLLHRLMIGKVRVHNLELPSMKGDAP